MPGFANSTAAGIFGPFGQFGQFSGRYANPEDAEEFERRINEDRAQCDERLVNNVVREIIQFGKEQGRIHGEQPHKRANQGVSSSAGASTLSRTSSLCGVVAGAADATLADVARRP